MIGAMQAFVRITGWLPQWCCFRTKVIYEDRQRQSRRIQGPAIIVSNHTSVFDYAVMLFVFPFRTLRYQMAEVLFRKPVLGPFLKMMGGLYVNRGGGNLSYMADSLQILRRGGVMGIFPEGRLPRPGETPPLPFQEGAAFLAWSAGVKVIPVYTNGSYFQRRRARVVIGTPMLPEDYAKPGQSERERLVSFSAAMREKIIALGEMTGDAPSME